MKKLFQGEADALHAEYRSVYDLVRFYQEKVKAQCQQLAEQECIISKLQCHVGANMRARLDDRVRRKVALQGNPVLDEDEFYEENWAPKPGERFRDPLKEGLFRRQFDLYGSSVRLLELPEREQLVKSVVLRDKQVEIKQLQDQNVLLDNQYTEMYSSWQHTLEELSELKIALRDKD